MSNFYLIVLRQKLDIMVHFQTFITHKHKYKTNFTRFVFIGQKNLLKVIIVKSDDLFEINVYKYFYITQNYFLDIIMGFVPI